MAGLTLSELRHHARTHYGLDPSTADARFTDTVMTRLINVSIKHVVSAVRPFKRDLTGTTIVAGTASYALDTTVIEVDPDGVQMQIGGAWRMLEHRDRPWLMRAFGAPSAQTSGSPRFFSLLKGYADDASKQIEFWPPPNAVLSWKYWAWVDIPDLANDNDTLELQDDEHYLVLERVKLEMAKLEKSLGGDAPVAMYAQQAAEKEALLRSRTNPMSMKIFYDDGDYDQREL